MSVGVYKNLSSGDTKGLNERLAYLYKQFAYLRSTASSGGNSYTLPIATSSVLGGIKVGTGLTINGAGILSTTPISSLDSIPQGTNQKWLSAADYAILQQIIVAFTTP